MGNDTIRGHHNHQTAAHSAGNGAAADGRHPAATATSDQNRTH